ncbi:branched-chain amino acid ABC transporter permease [Deinococcus metallilatus]|uniref:Branched-chain amino acid ABC transporter permease n=2 Tax=Deinococcus TaxID=1298 RepID=A0AAJ5JYN9_9DEIO|nr:branched-chain amino acid ABC transporter permease [Deinococcus metallilatus]MBB5294223.1 branched-chain amino acid transport system permease protein [Deinococcus metallilatus]QBY09001.1 branched-chain amino acid ABC transporter permease [Deinococcus metallilatus]RXJ10145.1 branched-chain amino acid ABC transporter permease [Deinococcus metallilatus]TLK27918.1 branched-chain amino acid ABC transporter permease [Deinococcus metallilatus]GMA16440.1 branched-chain amino acid ABC transporter pe
MDLATLLPFIVNVIVGGLVLGFVYAIIALGYTMVYGVLQLINFAHSEVFVTGAIVGYEVFRVLAPNPMNGYLKLLLALLAAMTVSGVLNVLIERLAYRPLRNAPRLVPLITAIGVSLILQDVLRVIEGFQGRFDLTYILPESFGTRFCAAQSSCAALGNVLRTIGIDLQVKDVILIVVALLSLGGLNYLVNRTRLGKAIRAVAQDRVTAGLMGIDADRMISMTFLIGGALGGISGVLFGLKVGTVNAYSGFDPGIVAFTAAVLGGIGSIPGAVLGGLVLGVIQNLIGVTNIFGQILGSANLQAIDASYQRIGAFLVLVLILIFKPTGLLGKSNVEKV